MKLKTTWTCPECQQQVPIQLDTFMGVSNGTRIKVRVAVPATALADAFAHAWTHTAPGRDEEQQHG